MDKFVISRLAYGWTVRVMVAKEEKQDFYEPLASVVVCVDVVAKALEREPDVCHGRTEESLAGR